MEFDHLLRKYLAGSISDAELKRFRDLLDRSPEYRLELRQTLELRSIIQDDALSLAPPEDLSERIRMSVGEQFAAESVVRRDREERRRRAGIFPFRIAAGVMATTFVALMVTIGPSLIQRFGNSPATSANTASRVEFVLPGGDVADGGIVPQRAPYGAEENGTQDAVVVRTPQAVSSSRSVANASHTGTTHRQRIASQPATTSSAVASNDAIAMADQSGEAVTPAAVSPSMMLRSNENTESVKADVQEDQALLERLAALGAQEFPPYQPNTQELKPPVALAAANSLEMLAQPGESDARRLTVGVSLGSGRVTETTSPTPLMQNSYYFAFSLSRNDRIGLEMGNSAFQQNNSVTSFSPSGVAAKGSKGAFGAKLTSAGDVTDEGKNPTTSNRQATLIEQRAEQQLTYGTIFYDRRLQLNDEWDLCGRVGVGAADNALVGHLRAYAAFSPSKKVTLTIGVGGSSLQSLNSRDAGGSANYGIYYGIETGF